jgi:hypothetical protein
VNDVDEFFSSLKRELTEGILSAHNNPQLIEELIKLEGYSINLDKSTVEFVLEAIYIRTFDSLQLRKGLCQR